MLRHSRPFILAAALVIAPALIIVTTPDPARPRARAATITTPDQPEYGLAGIVGPVTEIRAQEAAQVEAARIAAEMAQAAAEARSRETRARATATARPTPASPPSSNGNRCQYADQILAAGLPPAMVDIAWRESNCTADAASPTECLGLFQTCWPLHADIEQAQCGRSDRDGMFDIACNIAITVSLWNGGRGAYHWNL